MLHLVSPAIFPALSPENEDFEPENHPGKGTSTVHRPPSFLGVNAVTVI